MQRKYIITVMLGAMLLFCSCSKEGKDGASFIDKKKKEYAQQFRKPVEVFVFHAVSDKFDEKRYMQMDWSQTDEFKKHIRTLKSRYTFIPLEEACRKIRSRSPRWRHYAVLTCDDGFASVLEVLPFLEEEKIPVTLFINPKYLDGVSHREGYAEAPQYLTHDQLWSLTSPLVTIGMHGYEHDNATKKTAEEFEESVEKCKEILQSHPRYIPYYAYTWGIYSDLTQQILHQKEIVPLLVNGKSNKRYHGAISRRPIDSYYWEKTLKYIGMSE